MIKYLFYKKACQRRYRDMTSTGWCFTIFDDVDGYEMKYRESVVHRACYQTETCPTTGREHIQGYVQFTKSKIKKQCY